MLSESVKPYKDQDPSWFNEDSNLKRALETLLDQRERSCKVQVKNWVKDYRPDKLMLDNLLLDLSARGKTSLVSAIIDCEANPNCHNKHGDTPLSLAIRNGQAECASLLFDQSSSRFDFLPGFVRCCSVARMGRLISTSRLPTVIWTL